MTKKTKTLILIILASVAALLSMIFCVLKESSFSTAIAIFSCTASLLGISFVFSNKKRLK